jgi:hypothetical protein
VRSPASNRLLHATHAAFAKSISLAFLAPKLVQGAVEGRLPWGIGGARLRLPRGRINTPCSVCRFDPERKFPLTLGTGLESRADFIKPCLDEETYGLKHQQKAGETRSHDAHFRGLTAPTFVQERALICAAILLSFLMPAAA